MVSEIVDGLERKGLLERERDSADRRRTLVWLTGAGQDTLRRDCEVLAVETIAAALARRPAPACWPVRRSCRPAPHRSRATLLRLPAEPSPRNPGVTRACPVNYTSPPAPVERSPIVFAPADQLARAQRVARAHQVTAGLQPYRDAVADAPTLWARVTAVHALQAARRAHPDRPRPRHRLITPAWNARATPGAHALPVLPGLPGLAHAGRARADGAASPHHRSDLGALLAGRRTVTSPLRRTSATPPAEFVESIPAAQQTGELLMQDVDQQVDAADAMTRLGRIRHRLAPPRRDTP